jgi:hypothetical protein
MVATFIVFHSRYREGGPMANRLGGDGATNIALGKSVMRHLGVALTFAVTGALSSQLLPFHGSFDIWRLCVPPVPFALLSALLFLRTPKAVLIVPLNVAVWLVAYFTVMLPAPFKPRVSVYLLMLAGGLVGGVGLVLCAAIHHHDLLGWRYLVAGGLIGGLAALPFGVCPCSPPVESCFLYSFAIWQAAVGTYLYAICTRQRVREEDLSR